MDAALPRSEWRVRRYGPMPGQPRVDDLLESGTGVVPVRMLVQQEERITGWDDGVLGFDEDAVWFSGRSTSFRAVATDVSRRPVGGWTPSDLTSTGRTLRGGIPLRHPGRDLRVRVAVIPSPERREWEDEDVLAREIERIVDREESEGQSQYPPLLVRPGFAVRALVDAVTTEDLFGFSVVPDRLANPARFVLDCLAMPRRLFWGGVPVTLDEEPSGRPEETP